MTLCKAAGEYRPRLGTDALLFPQTALVSFATTGEKTVAAVMTCRNEAVSVENDWHLGFSSFLSAGSPENQKCGHIRLVS